MSRKDLNELLVDCDFHMEKVSSNPTAALYRLSRSINRILQAVSSVCPDRKAFIAALQNVILEEKRFALKLMKAQIEHLTKIKSPQIIIDKHQEEYDCIANFLEYDRVSEISEKLFSSVDDEDQLGRDMLDLSTSFADSDWPMSLNANTNENWKVNLLLS